MPEIMDIMEILNIIVSAVSVLFVPGFALSYVFFPKKNEIDWIERIALSLGLSMSIVPFAIFCLNLILSVKINALSTLLTSFVIVVIALAAHLERKNKFFRRRVLRK